MNDVPRDGGTGGVMVPAGCCYRVHKAGAWQPSAIIDDKKAGSDILRRRE